MLLGRIPVRKGKGAIFWSQPIAVGDSGRMLDRCVLTQTNVGFTVS